MAGWIISYLALRTIWKNLLNRKERRETGVGGIVVSIAAFQAFDPGSIRGRRILYFRPEFSTGKQKTWQAWFFDILKVTFIDTGCFQWQKHSAS